jgi:membrane protein required for colicin V production
VVVGIAVLLLTAATPPERMPAWITKAALFPLAAAAGGMLRAFAPQGLKVAHDVADNASSAVAGAEGSDEGTPSASAAPTHKQPEGRGMGYTDSQRKALNALVEKSR